MKAIKKLLTASLLSFAVALSGCGGGGGGFAGAGGDSLDVDLPTVTVTPIPPQVATAGPVRLSFAFSPADVVGQQGDASLPDAGDATYSKTFAADAFSGGGARFNGVKATMNAFFKKTSRTIGDPPKTTELVGTGFSDIIIQFSNGVRVIMTNEAAGDNANNFVGRLYEFLPLAGSGDGGKYLETVGRATGFVSGDSFEIDLDFSPLPVSCGKGVTAATFGQCPPPTVAMQTCPDGSMIPAADTCPVTMQTCPDGSTILAADTCPVAMKTCPDGSTIPATDNCPPLTEPIIACGSACPSTVIQTYLASLPTISRDLVTFFPPDFYIIGKRIVGGTFAYNINPNDFSNRIVQNDDFIVGYYDLDNDNSYLYYGAWAAADVNDRGGFVSGIKLPSSQKLPINGTATYSGRAGIFVGSDSSDGYFADSAFTATFGGQTKMSGMLTADDNKFNLMLGESTYNHDSGKFIGGTVACGEVGNCVNATGDATWEGAFFITHGASLDESPTRFGGTFRADGLSLDSQAAANVVGGFGARFVAYMPPPPQTCHDGSTIPASATCPFPDRIVNSLIPSAVALTFNPARDRWTITKTGGTGWTASGTANQRASSSGQQILFSFDGSRFSETEYLYWGAWDDIAAEKGAFAIGAPLPDNYRLPTTGTAIYEGSWEGLIPSFAGGISRSTTFTALFGSTETTMSGTSPLLRFGEATFRGGRFSGGAVECNTNCAGILTNNTWEGSFFGAADSTKGGAPSRFGGTFRVDGVSFFSSAVGNLVGGFGAELDSYTP